MIEIQNSRQNVSVIWPWKLEFIWDLEFVIWNLRSQTLFGSGYAGLGRLKVWQHSD
jgi:hypothetical protein